MKIDLAKKELRTILVVTLSNLGDVILTIPMIAALRDAFPQATIDVVVGEKAFGLLNENPLLDTVYCFNKKWSLKEKTAFVWALRKKKYGHVVDFRNSLIPYLIGVPSKSLPFNNQLRKIVSRYERIAVAKQICGLRDVRAEKFPLFTARDTEAIMLKLHSKGMFNASNLLVVSPGARSQLKQWPPQHFAELIRLVVSERDMPVVLVGDTCDEAAARVVEDSLSCEVVNMVGKTTQKESAVLVARAGLVLSNDSAIMHLANYYARPVVGIFGPTDAAKYGYESAHSRVAKRERDCMPCSYDDCPHDNACLHDLLPKDVLPLVREVLASA